MIMDDQPLDSFLGDSVIPPIKFEVLFFSPILGSVILTKAVRLNIVFRPMSCFR